MRTVNGLRQGRQFQRPGRVVLPLERVASPTVPQCGQTGPSGQSHASTYVKAALSSAKCRALRADFMALSHRQRIDRARRFMAELDLAFVRSDEFARSVR